jgi:hypothetical protein
MKKKFKNSYMGVTLKVFESWSHTLVNFFQKPTGSLRVFEKARTWGSLILKF